MAYLWAVLSPHVASVHYGDNTTHIYAIILQLWSARLCGVCTLRCWHYVHLCHYYLILGGVVPSCSVCTLREQHYPYLCHYSFGLTNGQVFALDIDVHGAAFADGASQNKVCDFIFDRRCNQTFQWARAEYSIVSIVAQPFDGFVGDV